VRRLRPNFKRDEGEDLILKAHTSADSREGVEAFLFKLKPV
jgi:hypothetical protein